MKTSSLMAFVLSLTAALTSARAADASQSSVPAPTAYREVARGANHKVWQREIYEPGPDGKMVARVHSFTELASGLHYQKNGQWEEAQEKIEVFSGGAVARQGQHQVIFANNLNSYGAIDMQTPDGKRLRSNVLGLMYYDTASGNAVLIARLQDSEGQLIADNQVLYPDVFEGLKADVRYTYSKGGFEQDVILQEQPLAPEAYGLNSETTELEVFTEFIDPPAASLRDVQADGTTLEADQEVSWGAVNLGRGKAFNLGSQESSTSVVKRYMTVQGRQYLLEKVSVKAIQASLSQLPEQASTGKRLPMMATKNPTLPPTPKFPASAKAMKLALGNVPDRGYVLDYVTLTAAYTNYTFKGDTTYYVSSALTLYGTNTFEGGTVIKFAANASITEAAVTTAAFSPQVVFNTFAYVPVVFTAKDDNSIGENVGGTGSPSGFYASPALTLSGLSAHQLSGAKFLYAKTAVAAPGTALTLNNVQFVKCASGVSAAGNALNVNNALFLNVNTNFNLTGSGTVVAANQATFNNAQLLVNNPTGSYLLLTNCILANVTNTAGTIYAGNCGFYRTTMFGSSPVTNAFYPFKQVGAGSCYLTNGCTFYNAGATNIAANTMALIKQRTTYPPLVYSNVTINVATTLSPQAGRDTELPDLGYHYDPLDYVFGSVNLYSNLTFSAGTSVGFFVMSTSAGYGLMLYNGANVAFKGNVGSPCHYARYNNVQEGGNGVWTLMGWLAGIAGTGAGYPKVTAQFTIFSGTANSENYVRDYYGETHVEANHCEFYSGVMTGYGMFLRLTNNLFEHITWLGNGTSGSCGLAMRNCTMHGGGLYVQHWSGATWPVWIENCVFDGTDLTTYMNEYSGGNTNITYCDFNAFTTNSTARLPILGTHDVLVNNFNWQTSWRGNFYLPATSILINSGSTTADQVGLYQFTTQTNQVKEANSQVDIGYHYVATGSGGIDTIWVEDSVPGGAGRGIEGGDSWTWVSSNPAPYSGQLTHQSVISSSQHQHYFQNATNTLAVNAGDSLMCYVYLDPTNIPSEVMLQWNDGSWEHRAYWGVNSIGWGTDGTTSRRYMGALPTTGQWVRLEVPASAVGLEGQTLNGMAYALVGGRVTWDYAGKSGEVVGYDSDSDGISDYQEDSNGNGLTDNGENPWGIRPAITGRPLNQTVSLADDVTFTVAATGVPTPGYQWYFKGNALAGQTNATLQFENIQTNSAGNYSVTVANSQGSTNVAFTVTVNIPYYSVLSGSLTNLLLKGDTTYYVNSTVQLYGTTTIEGGTVIKYGNHPAVKLVLNGTLVSLTDAYRPAMLTSRDDNTVGSRINCSSGTPPTAQLSANYLVDGGGQTNAYRDLHICYASTGITGANAMNVWDCQFFKCGTAVGNTIGNAIALHNVLVAEGSNCVSTIGTVSAEFLTADKCSTFCPLSYGGARLTNSILTSITNTTGVNLVASASQASGDGVFQTVGGGHYYLATNTFQAQGSANVSQQVLADIAAKTTCAPIYFYIPGIWFYTNLSVFPQARRDTNAVPDLGYHYAPLDYIFSPMYVTNATITINPGTTVGFHGFRNAQTYGVGVANDGNLNCLGEADRKVQMLVYNLVQEQSPTNWVTPYYGLAARWAGTNICQINSRFTDWSCFAQDVNLIQINVSGALGFRHCQFRGGMIIVSDEALNSTVDIFNCLFERVMFYLESGGTNAPSFRNNLVYGGDFEFYPWAVNNAVITDNLFDQPTISSVLGDDGATYIGGHNAYVTNCSQLPSFASDIILPASPAYQTGSLGRYYLPTNSPLINAGSTTAGQVGLYHFTTQTNRTKEAGSQVDLGYHYVVTDLTDSLLDTNGDGIPDYIEDANGNGVVDVGESNWGLYIMTPPADQSVILGANATFTVAVASMLPLYYQWYFNASPIAGATTATLTLNNVQPNSAGSYFVVVTNISGSGTSTPAILNVITKPVVLVSPISKTALVADTVQLSATAIGVAPLAYQWQWNGVNLSGATNATLTLPTVQLSQSGNYRVVVSNSYGATYSLLAALRVWQPGIIQMVSSDAFSDDMTRTITNLDNVVAVTSGGMSGTNLALMADGTVVAWSVNSGRTNASIGANLIYTGLSNVVAIAEGSDYYHYYCYALKADGTVVSTSNELVSDAWNDAGYQNVIAISVNNWNCAPLYSDGTADAYVYIDNYTSFIHISATNVMAIVCSADAYLVLKDDGTLQAWGGSPDLYNQVTDVYGETVIPAQLTNTPGAVIGIAAGFNHFMALKSNRTVVAWGDNNSSQCNVPAGLTNVWNLATGVGGSLNGSFNGYYANHDYADSLALKSDGTLVKWMIYIGSSASSRGSNYVALAGNATIVGDASYDGYIPFDDWAIYGAPQITEQPASQAVCSASLFTLSAGVATGSPVRNYQWRKNGVNLTDGGNISGATNAMLSFASFAASDVGNYSVVLANEGGAVTSTPAILSITTCTAPVITQQPQSQLLGVGTTATFTVAASGPSPLNYQWRKDGNNLFNGGTVSGAISPTLTIRSLSVADRGNYDVVVGNPAGVVVSSSASLSVFQLGVDTDGDGLPDTIDADINNPDTTPPVFVITAPAEWATY